MVTIRNGSEGWRGFAFEVKFNGVLQVGDGLFACGTKAGNVHLEALRSEEFVLPINTVGRWLHTKSLSRVQRIDGEPHPRPSPRAEREISFRRFWSCGRRGPLDPPGCRRRVVLRCPNRYSRCRQGLS